MDKALKDAETAAEAALQVIAGPTTNDQLVMLDLCVDALKATAAISSNRMQTLDSALHTLRTLINLETAVSQVLHVVAMLALKARHFSDVHLVIMLGWHHKSVLLFEGSMRSHAMHFVSYQSSETAACTLGFPGLCELLRFQTAADGLMVLEL